MVHGFTYQALPELYKVIIEYADKLPEKFIRWNKPTGVSLFQVEASDSFWRLYSILYVGLDPTGTKDASFSPHQARCALDLIVMIAYNQDAIDAIHSAHALGGYEGVHDAIDPILDEHYLMDIKVESK